MNTEATAIDQTLSFYDSCNPSSHGPGLSPLSSPPLSGRDGLKIVTEPAPLFPSSSIELAPCNEPSKPIPIIGSGTEPMLLPPVSAPHPRAATYAGREISTSPAMAFLSCFKASPRVQSRDIDSDEIAGFTLAETIGYGGFSTIRRAYSSSGGVVAVKVVPHRSLASAPNITQARKQLNNETTIWSSLNHEHILPLFTHTTTSYAQYFFTLYCPAGSLFDILKRDGRPALPQDDVGMMFRQVVRGLRYLHESVLLAHRDIKLENVLVDEMGICRISDFGLAKKIGEPQVDVDDELTTSLPPIDGLSRQDIPTSDTVDVPSLARASSFAMPNRRVTSKPSNLRQSLVRGHGSHAAKHRNSTTTSSHPRHTIEPVFLPGSLPYAAPEILVPQNSSGPILVSAAQDIWALGVLLYTLLKGRLPFNDPFEPRLQMKILHGAFDLPIGIGKGAERVLKGCMERTVANRLTIAMVDDVAWGIGWGAEGDDVSPDEEGASTDLFHDGEEVTSPRSRSRSSRSRARYAPTSPVSEKHHSHLPHHHHHHHQIHHLPSEDETHDLRHHHPVFSDNSDQSSRSVSGRGSSGRTRSSSSNRSTSTNGGGPSLLTAMLANQGISESVHRGRRRHKHLQLPEEKWVHSASRSPSPIPATPQDSDFSFLSVDPRHGGISERLGDDVRVRGNEEEVESVEVRRRHVRMEAPDKQGFVEKNGIGAPPPSSGVSHTLHPWTAWPMSPTSSSEDDRL